MADDEILKDEQIEDAGNTDTKKDRKQYGALIECIKDYCKRENVSYRQLSLALHKTPGYIGQIISGEGTPSLDSFIDILNIINVAPVYALEDHLCIDGSKIVNEALQDILRLEEMDKLNADDLKLSVGFLRMLIDMRTKE